MSRLIKSRLFHYGINLTLLLILILAYLGLGFNQASSKENKLEVNIPPLLTEDKKLLEDYFTKIGSVYNAIKTNYVSEVSAQAIFENALKGMVARLDPYSEYFNADEYREFQIDTKGEFGGIGIVVTYEDGVITIITPLEDTPAFRAGILAGDQIIEIEGESIEGLSFQKCIKRMRGHPGTQITLTVLHKQNTVPEKITITREIIKVKTIKQPKIIDEVYKIGYIRITAFHEDTLNSFSEAVQKLQRKNMKSLIIDLRFNGGGLLEQAVELTNLFIPQGIIVSTRGRQPNDVKTMEADPKKTIYSGLPLVILVNGGSASASEIFAGALQDHQRATLVGSRTYGKGSVQVVYEISEDKSAVKLTIAKYYTPSGKCIQREKGKKDYGLEPDVVVAMTVEQEAELLKSRREVEIIQPSPTEKPLPFEDIQLQKAIELLAE